MIITAKCRKNDYFKYGGIYSAFLQILDTLSDVFFVIDVLSHIQDNNGMALQLILILILSISFIILPISISLHQLNTASTKHWLKDNRIREWLLTNSKLLYFTSVVTGSSFAAIEIFNSNLFGLDLFYMGLNVKMILSFSAKKIYSVIAFENVPQLILSIWFSVLLENAEPIPLSSMILSLISIVVMIVSMTLQKQIYETQDSVFITFDITGECVVDNIGICEKRIKKIKKYLSQSVLGINEKSVQIMKPFIGQNIRNGVQMQMHVLYIHNKSVADPAVAYEKKLYSSIESEDLLEIIKDEWCLSELPSITNVCCNFVESKEKKKLFESVKNLETMEGENEEIRLEEDCEMTNIKLSQMTEPIRLDAESAKSPKFKILS